MNRYTRSNAPVDLLKYDEWPEVSLSALDDEAVARFTALKKALIRYMEGDKVQEIQDDEGYSREALIRAFNRCITRRPDGRLVGWLGLVPGVRIGAPARVKPLAPSGRNGKSGLTGACALFMNQHPKIEAAFKKYLFKTATRQVAHENKVRPGIAHKWFIAHCREQGIPENQWPLNTDKLGRGAISEYIRLYLAANYDAIVATQYGQKAKTKSHSGTGTFSRLRASQFLDVVELDEHLCHFKGWIAFETPGGKRWVKSPRLSLIAMVDRLLGLVVGLKIIFRSQARGDDILEVLHHACTGGGVPVDASAKGEANEPAMPIDLGIPFEWCGLNQLLVDNALSHLAEEIQGRARALLGCDINFGPVQRPERRPNVEGLFSDLERLGFHRLDETTGSGPQDPIRIEAPPAREPQMTEAAAIALIYRSVRFHNRKRSSGAYGVRRIEQLQGWVNDTEQGLIFPMLPPPLDHLPSLDVSVTRLKVKGSEQTGVRAHLYLQEESYAGEALSERWDLIGQWVMAHMNRHDARYMRLFTLKGESLGTATVTGRWRHPPHTLSQRIITNKLIRDGQLRIGYDEDPIAAHLAQIAHDAAKDTPLSADQIKTLTAHAENEHSRQQNANSVAQAAVTAAIENAKKEPAGAGKEERRFVMPQLRAFNRGQR